MLLCGATQRRPESQTWHQGRFSQFQRKTTQLQFAIHVSQRENIYEF